jgi:predicted Zn-dependent protease
MSDRIAALLALLEKRPDDSRLLFGLASEYEKLGQWADVVAHLRAYLESTDDEGNAWGRLGHALRMLGREDEAHAAFASGIDAARRHGHSTMAAEFEEVLEDRTANEQ